MIGKWVNFRNTGIAAKSKVLRVYSRSNVRMPRSQRITLELPSERIYSAAISQSSIVAAKPRLSSTGLFCFPTCLSNEKFCIFLAPICSTSATSAILSISAVSITSVMIPKPLAFRAAANRDRALSPCP